MVEVLVEYDYTAQAQDELTIKKGDVIKEVIKKQGGWWEGLLNEKRGMFPDNFVKVIEKDGSVTLRSRKDAKRIRQCRVVFSYKQDHPDELNLNVGDIINILGEEEEGWWRGTLNGVEGVFPSNFVEEIKSKPGSKEDLSSSTDSELKSPILPPKPIKSMCQVKYSYKAQNEDELTLKEGDLINVISKDGQDPGWWKGELNGQVGVFPDNFVLILNDLEDRKITKTLDQSTLKHNVVSSQRKSIEEKNSEKIETENAAVRVTPPIPSKKPIIPVKKSPSGSSSQSGILAGLRKKIVDVVDGASSSKSQPVLLKANDLKEETPENAFDQVERTSMLSDVRATRAKAPGRRPPSVVFKEGEPGIVNGNTDHALLDSLSEHFANSRTNDVNEQMDTEVKPKVREWEKHKAPWLEEMKLNQAKRTSTSPGPEQNKLKLTPTDKSVSPEIDENKSSKSPLPFDRPSSSPIDMTKSMSTLNNKLKTPPNELEKSSVVLRNKAQQQAPPIAGRPQSIHNSNDQKFSINSANPKVSPAAAPSQNKISPKPVVAEKSPDVRGGGDFESVSSKQYLELVQRLEKLENLVQQQHQTYKAAIEELKGKLQVEIDMRNLLQAELEKFSQCVMQV